MPRATTHGSPLTFRAWLVMQLKLSRWSSIKGETHAELARRLGVQEDVLTQAVTEREQGIREKAKRQILELALVKTWMPEEVARDWLDLAKRLEVTEAHLIRALLARFLDKPEVTQSMLRKGWIYRGKRYSAHAATRKHLLCRVSRGARLAMIHHARMNRITVAALLKGLILDLLEGRSTRLKMVLPSDMWGDHRRYLEPELFQDPLKDPP